MEDPVVIMVTVALRCRPGCDPQAVVDDMDYQFDHPAIIDTEIVDFAHDLDDHERLVDEA
jgi:hypothetical protein